VTGEQSRESGIAIAGLQSEVRGLQREMRDVRADLQADIKELKDEVRSMKRGFYGLIFSLLGGMLLFLLSVASGWIGA
jgi:hypothetical protein